MPRLVLFCSLLFAFPAVAAAQIRRLPLPVPFLPIRGATPVPGNGAGISMDLGRGLLGPELAREKMMGLSVSLGLNDWFTVSVGAPHAQDQVSGRARAYLQQLRLKVPVLRPRGLRPAIALSVARSWGDLRVSRRATTSGVDLETLQDDHVGSWDLAIPAEFLLKQHGKTAHTSLFVGPRMILTSYEDRLQAGGPFGAVLPAGVAGIHVSVFMFELFAETNLVYLPQRSYAGSNYGGGLSLMPSLGGTLRMGRAFSWKKPASEPPPVLPGYGDDGSHHPPPPPRR